MNNSDLIIKNDFNTVFNYNIFKLGRKSKNYTNECKRIL